MFLGEELITLLTANGMVFGQYREGMTNIPAVCPFHVSDGRKKPFYVYVGPPGEKRSPGSSFCHRCDEGWGLPKLLRRLGAPLETIDTAQKYLSLILRKKRGKQDRWKSLIEMPYTLPETILGLWDYWPTMLVDEGFTEETLEYAEAGFDRENLRITFPIRDHVGRFVGVSGRGTRAWHVARYKVYKEEFHHLIFNYELRKGLTLWGMHNYYETRMRSGTLQPPITVCEGFKATMYVRQCGIPHVVASMGSALTDQQIRLLSLVTNRVIMFWDHDDAGREALQKVVRRLRNAGLIVEIANYETQEKLSPDDLSPEQVLWAVRKPISFRKWMRQYGTFKHQPPIGWEQQSKRQ